MIARTETWDVEDGSVGILKADGTGYCVFDGLDVSHMIDERATRAEAQFLYSMFWQFVTVFQLLEAGV